MRSPASHAVVKSLLYALAYGSLGLACTSHALHAARASPLQVTSTRRPPLGPVLLRLEGKGDQVYRCVAGASGAPAASTSAPGAPEPAPAWVLDRPDAVLLDAQGVKVGSHGAGPAWRYKDGSAVHGEVLEKMPAPAPGSIPWLLLRASSHEGSGVLAAAETIERTETHGGVAPAVGCDAAHLGALQRVPYTATYTFHGKVE